MLVGRRNGGRGFASLALSNPNVNKKLLFMLTSKIPGAKSRTMSHDLIYMGNISYPHYAQDVNILLKL